MSGDQLEQLRAEIDALRKETAASAAQLEQDRNLTAAALKRLKDTFTDFVENPVDAAADAEDEDEEEEVPEAVAWVDYATEQDWTALCDWVDWLHDVYDLDDARRVWPCWPAHLGVAEELAAVWSAWLEAASRAQVADGDALAFWHDRYLTPFLGRVQRVYNIGLCREKHTPMRKAAPTNRTLIDVRSAALPEQDDDSAAADVATGGPVLAGVAT